MNFIDKVLCEVDVGLRTLFARTHTSRPTPLSSNVDTPPLRSADESIRLMRVNHCGEVCAQALYQAQALVARDEKIAAVLHEAAAEERDHLAWCAARVHELGGQTSYLTPLFYAGSFGLGIASGLLGDKWSLGFLVETERQVEAHLADHLQRLPAEDHASSAILQKMQADEIRHGDTGEQHGGLPLPPPVRWAMTGFSKVMTRSTYWV